MKLKDLKERLESLIKESDTDYELIVTICLLFYGLKLEDICELRITDIYGDYKHARTRIRKLEFFMPDDLRDWLYEYSAFYLWKKDLIRGEMLLPVYRNPTRLAKCLEDHGVIPEEVFALGRQCYVDYLDRFNMTNVIGGLDF
jgi:hypothetical protein